MYILRARAACGGLIEGISPEPRDARAVQGLKQSYKMRERLLLLLLLAVPWIHGEYLVSHPGPSILWDAAGESGSGSTPLLRDAPPVEAAGSGGGGGSGSGSGMPFINVRECCRVESLSGYLLHSTITAATTTSLSGR